MKEYQKHWVKILRTSDSTARIRKTLKQIINDDTGHTDELTQLLAKFAYEKTK